MAWIACIDYITLSKATLLWNLAASPTMVLLRTTAAFWAVQTLLAAATPTQVPMVETVMTADPTVQLDQASFTGKTRGDSAHYLGIPFAYPPYVLISSRYPLSMH